MENADLGHDYFQNDANLQTQLKIQVSLVRIARNFLLVQM